MQAPRTTDLTSDGGRTGEDGTRRNQTAVGRERTGPDGRKLHIILSMPCRKLHIILSMWLAEVAKVEGFEEGNVDQGLEYLAEDLE